MKNRALCIGLLAALPALAQDGFTVGANIGLVKASVSNAMTMGSYYQSISTPGGTGIYQYDSVQAEYGNQMPLGLDLGYRMGGNTFALRALYSSKKNGKTLDPGTSSRYLGLPWSGSVPVGVPVNTETKLETLLVDLVWEHVLTTGATGTLTSTTGLRFGSFRNNCYSNYSTADGSNWVNVSMENKTDAVGLIVGLGYSYPLSSSLSLGANLNFAFVQGDNKGTFESAEHDISWSTPDQIGRLSGTEKNHAATQTDMCVHLDWKVASMVDLRFGYRHMDFGKVATYAAMQSYYYATGNEVGGAYALSGVTVGASFRF